MPHLTGMELTEKMLAQRPDLPVILCTGFSALISEQEALGRGVRCFLSKPVVGMELAAAVRKVLDREEQRSSSEDS